MHSAIETVTLPDAAPSPASVRALVQALEHGHVVGLPRETVYGLAVRGDRPEARARLAEAAGSEALPTWQVASAAALAGWDALGARVERLVARYWPGPLALLLPGAPPAHPELARDGWTSVRAPAHAGLAAVLAAAPFPVVALDARRPDGRPCLLASDVAEHVGARVHTVGDGGPCRLGEASTGLAIGPGRFEVLHTGLLDRHDLLQTAGRRIAFVCTGNTCRSPMARVLARALVAERLGGVEASDARLAEFGFEIGSFGVAAGPGARASQHAVTAMRRRGIDLSSHRSTQAVPEELARFDEILGLTRSHVAAITAALPPRLAARVALLDPQGRDVADPVGGSLEDYLACAEAITAALDERVRSWV